MLMLKPEEIYSKRYAPNTYAIGDTVKFHVVTQSNKANKINGKLAAIWSDPYRIVAKTSDNVLILQNVRSLEDIKERNAVQVFPWNTRTDGSIYNPSLNNSPSVATSKSINISE